MQSRPSEFVPPASISVEETTISGVTPPRNKKRKSPEPDRSEVVPEKCVRTQDVKSDVVRAEEKLKNVPEKIPTLSRYSLTYKVNAGRFNDAYAARYHSFFNSLVKNHESYTKTDTPTSKIYYLPRTADVEYCARSYLTAFLSNSEHFASLTQQLKKSKPTVTFVTLTCGNKKICIVSVSGRGDANDIERDFFNNFKKLTANYPYHPAGYEFDLVLKRNPNFDWLVKNVLMFNGAKQISSPLSSCGEKKIGSYIEKLIYRYGNQLHLDGMISCSLSNIFQLLPSYLGEAPIDILHKGNPAWVSVIPPCDHCKQNIPATHEIWHNANRYEEAPASPLETHSFLLSGEVERYVEEDDRERSMSPRRG